MAIRVVPSGIMKLHPVMNRKTDIRGKVNSRSHRRPNLSIVQIAGSAPRKLSMPKPKDAHKALTSEKPASTKITDE